MGSVEKSTEITDATAKELKKMVDFNLKRFIQ